MARKQTCLAARGSDPWKASHARLSADRQAAGDKAAIALIKQQSSSSLQIKPIRPDKYYQEAHLTSGDRIVFRIEQATLLFVDIVSHDEISRYSRRPRRRG